MRLALVHPSEVPETFVAAHLQHLDADITALWDGFFPSRSSAGPVFRATWAHRFLFRLGRRTIGFNGELFYERRLVELLERRRIDVVLAEYGPTGAAVMGACARARVPLVVHFHGYDAYARSILAAYRRRYRRLFDQAAAIVSVSHHMTRQLLRLGSPASKTVYNPYGVDTALFHGQPGRRGPPVLVAVGRFVPKKAPHLTLRAFAQVLRERSDARLVMIGDGPRLASCRRLARQLALRTAVTFMGRQPPPAVAEALRGARAFVQHSVTAPNGDTEGTPVAILEAAASALPVVATRHGGIPDVVVDGETGYLVEEGDIHRMASCMLRLLADEPLATRLGAAGQQHILSHYSLDRSIRQLTAVVAGVAGRGV